MLNNLPESLKQQILCYLEAADFKAAKELRDNYLSNALNFKPNKEFKASTQTNGCSWFGFLGQFLKKLLAFSFR